VVEGAVASTEVSCPDCERDGGEDAEPAPPTADAGPLDPPARVDAALPPAGCDHSALEDRAATLAPGEFAELTTAGLTADLHIQGANSIFDYTWEAFWDAGTCQVLFVGSGHLKSQKYVAYNASRNEWLQAPDPPFVCPVFDSAGTLDWGCAGHAYGMQAHDPDEGRYFYVQGGAIWSVQVDATLSNEWVRVADYPAYTGYASMVYMTPLERLVVVNANALHLVHPHSGAVETVEGPFPMGEYHFYGVYNPVTRDTLFGSGNGSTAMNLMHADGSITRAADAPKQFHPATTDTGTFKILTFDPASGVYLAHAPGGDMASYDSASDRWTPLGNRGPDSADVAAAITSYGVVMFVDRHANRVYLYKHA